MAGGETGTGDFSWSAEAGAHSFRAVVDGNRLIPETDEANNETKFDYDATVLADLVVEGLTWSPKIPIAEKFVDFTLTMRNQGQGEGNEYTVSVFVDGSSTPSWSLRFPRIQAGQSEITTFSWIGEEGAHTLKVVADAAGEVVESDESNNETPAFMVVAPAQP